MKNSKETTISLTGKSSIFLFSKFQYDLLSWTCNSRLHSNHNFDLINSIVICLNPYWDNYKHIDDKTI